MEKITLVAKAEVPKEARLLISGERLKEIVTKKLTEGIGEEVCKLINSEEGEGIIEKTTTLTGRNYDVHKIEITLVNEKELIKLKEEKERLEEENKKLKEKLDGFREVGLEEIVEGMKKAELMSEFVVKLLNLTEEYGERLSK